jgi:serine/threonine-protein kinase
MNESPQFPRPLGRYELVHLLGQGGMGEVYLAKISGAAGFEKPCIVKTILPTLLKDRQFLDRFHHEAKVLVHLVHSSIAQVYDMGEAEGTYYMALEYVAGVDLSYLQEQAHTEGRALPVSVALYLGQRIAEGLGYAHRKTGPDGLPLGIVHRDVSPHNVMVSYEGEVKVIDFGLAKSAARSKYTLPSTVMGKLGYMSPEQVRAEALDHRSDIYSCGVVVWELLAGRSLVPHGTVGEMMAAMSHPTVPALHELRPDVDPALDAVVRRALAPAPADRYARADDFARALNEQLLRTGSSHGAEEVGDFVRALCPEAFATQRKLLSRISQAGLRRTPTPGGELVPANTGVPANTARFTPLPRVPSSPASEPDEGRESTLVRAPGTLPPTVGSEPPRVPETVARVGAPASEPVVVDDKRRPVVLALAAVGLLAIGAAVGVIAFMVGRPSEVERPHPAWGGLGAPPPPHASHPPPPPPHAFHPPPPPPPEGAPRGPAPQDDEPVPPPTERNALAEVHPPPVEREPEARPHAEPVKSKPSASPRGTLISVGRVEPLKPLREGFVVRRGQQLGLTLNKVVQVVAKPKEGKAVLLGEATVKHVEPLRVVLQPDERVREAGGVPKYVVLPEVAASSQEPGSPSVPSEPRAVTATPAPTAEKPSPVEKPTVAEKPSPAEKPAAPRRLNGRVSPRRVGPFVQLLVITNTDDFTWRGCLLVIRGRDKHELLGMPPGGTREVPLSEFKRGGREVRYVGKDRVGLFCKEGEAEFYVKDL